MECGEGRSSGVVMRRQNEEQMFHVKHSAAKRELPREWVAKQELPRGGVAWRDFVRVGCECALGAGRVFAEVVRVAAHGAVPGGLRIGGGLRKLRADGAAICGRTCESGRPAAFALRGGE